jgi:isoquinoline 1-oxidoreductase subunit alpha
MSTHTTTTTITLHINGQPRQFKGDGDMPLLWYLRDSLRLTATKYGCGVGQCGSCTVHVGGAATRACVRPMSSLNGQRVTTLEGLARGEQLHPVQQAWLDEDVTQCGYCQGGHIMAAVDLLRRKPKPSDADIDTITNLCRCGTQVRIRKAIKLAATRMGGKV